VISFKRAFRKTRKAATVAAFLLLLFAIPLSLVGCASYQTKVEDARKALQQDDPSKAASLLEPLAHKKGDDQLVYLLDYATALQEARRYKDSAEAYQAAAKIADIQDYHSISKITASLLLSEEMIQYKGDDYEKVLIHAMNAVNYLELGELDDALVETRDLNTMLYKFKYEAKKNYDQNPFAFYLSALIWEANHDYDDAYIAFKSAYEVAPNYAPLRQDLVRASLNAQRPEELAKWKSLFPEVKTDSAWKDQSMGEIVLIYEQGWGPRKVPRPESPRFPMLIPYSSNTQSANLIAGDMQIQTSRIFSVSDVAIKVMNDDYARLVGMRLGGVAAKAVVADQIGQKNQALGAVAWLAMNLADRADVRQWSTLPQTFQIARLPLKAGKYKVNVKGLGYGAGPSGENMPEREVVVRPGKKTFISWRSVR
jgi:hypothetical protein